MKRLTGYYWVIFEGEKRIAEYFDIPECWYITGETGRLINEEFEWIDDKPIKP